MYMQMKSRAKLGWWHIQEKGWRQLPNWYFWIGFLIKLQLDCRQQGYENEFIGGEG